jgi:hypothetical protein
VPTADIQNGYGKPYVHGPMKIFLALKTGITLLTLLIRELWREQTHGSQASTLLFSK